MHEGLCKKYISTDLPHATTTAILKLKHAYSCHLEQSKASTFQTCKYIHPYMNSQYFTTLYNTLQY